MSELNHCRPLSQARAQPGSSRLSVRMSPPLGEEALEIQWCGTKLPRFRRPGPCCPRDDVAGDESVINCYILESLFISYRY